MELQGSCRCGAVTFSLLSHTPCPFMRCYCSICRKVAGCGGYAINIMAKHSLGISLQCLTGCGSPSHPRLQYDTMRVQGAEHLNEYKVMVAGEGGAMVASTNARYFCGRCGSHLWARDPQWAQWVYPFSGAIDSELPKPPHMVHMMLGSKAGWVEPQVCPGDEQYDGYPELGIEEWHKKHGVYFEGK